MSESKILIDGIKIEEPLENYQNLLDKIEKLKQYETSFDVFYFIKDKKERNFIFNDKDFNKFKELSKAEKADWQLYTKANNNYTYRPPADLVEHYKQLIEYQMKETAKRIKNRILIAQDLDDPKAEEFKCPKCKEYKFLASCYKCVICDNEPFCKSCSFAHEITHPIMKIPLKIES